MKYNLFFSYFGVKCDPDISCKIHFWGKCIYMKRAMSGVLVNDTCLGVSSSVAEEIQSRKCGAFIVICVEFELCLCIVTVLHEWNLLTQTYCNIIKQ